MPRENMNPEEIRKQTIIALFSDDYLFERLVLKGGNAIHIAHKLALRSSLDLDFSLAGDFEDLEEAQRHLFSTLKKHFSAIGFVVFDERFVPKPKIQGHDDRPWWGGYELSFKLISREKHDRLRDRLEKMRMDALPVGPKQERTFSVDLSKNEYTASKITIDFGEYSIPVYTLEMIAAEKLRAICQQMPEYGIKGSGARRARDFYDIHLIVTERGIDLRTVENLALIRNIFEAKRVPLSFLKTISDWREFHRGDWPAVINAVGGTLQNYDFYFDFVLGLVEQLEPLWIEDAPR
jgi:predicted nucleotidyltransferase component of viral defense system